MVNRYLNRKNYLLVVIMLIVVSLSVGFSAFQKQLYVSDLNFKVRLHKDVRVSDVSVSKTSGSPVSNFEEFNTSKLLGNVTFSNTSSYVLYKVDLSNYGNVKSGLLNVTNNSSGINYQICDSNGSNCSNNFETSVCNGSNCTLGSTKSIYVKVTPTSAGTKNIDLDFDFEPYNNVTYNNIMEDTSSFKTEVLSNSTYEITLTSEPEEVEVVGTAESSYDKNTGNLTITNIESDLTISARYKATEVAETSYSGSNPDNYVSFNNTLYRIVTKGSINDGYGNTEDRVKIVKHESIGKKVFDTTTNEYKDSSLSTELNTTYYNSLSQTAKDLIDTALWKNETVFNIGLISSSDYTSNSSWLTYEEYTIDSASDNKVVAINSELINSLPSEQRDTHPATYLKTDVLIVGGDGTSTNPYLLELKNDTIQSNPTVIAGKTLTVTGSNQQLVSVTNKVGTVYYSTEEALTIDNYTTGSTSLPEKSSVGTYEIYYYIPAGSGYKAKSGKVESKINALTFTITYAKGSNVQAIGKTSDSCTTSGSSLTCSVTLPSITPKEGCTIVGWSATLDDTTGQEALTSYTLSSNGVKLYANASVIKNYQNTTTLTYFGTLNSAFSSVSNNQTIKVLQNVTETNNAALQSGKTGVKLDLNGKTITMSNAHIKNNGMLDIYNTSSTTGTITGNTNLLLVNDGTLTLNETSSTYKIVIDGNSSNSSTIRNYSSKSLKVNDNVEIKANSGTFYGIDNSGIVTITGGTITGPTGILNYTTGELNISGSSTKITGTSSYGIYNYSIITITGGTITGSNGIYNYTGSELNISGSSTQITGTSKGIYNYNIATITGGTITGSTGIYNCSTGELNISGSNTQITGTSSSGIFNTGTTIITGGTITGYYGIYNYHPGGELNISGSNTQIIGTSSYGIRNDGNATITGGTITGINHGISTDRGALTLGVNDSSVSTTSPLVQTTGSSNKYGVYVESGCPFNFYDGIVSSASGAGYALNVEPDNVPVEYIIQKDLANGVESAYLRTIVRNYQNTGSNIYYERLKDAFKAVGTDGTEKITILNSVTETVDATLDSGKTVYLTINSLTLTMDNCSIINNGYLEIQNSKSGTAGYGNIEGGTSNLITNNGILVFIGKSSSRIVVRKTSVTNDGAAIWNSAGANLYLERNMNTYTSDSSCGIVTYGTVSSGTPYVHGNLCAIDIKGGTVTLRSGTITGDQGHGIILESGTLTLNGSIPTDIVPNVTTSATSGAYAIYVPPGSTNVTFNYYSGQIRSSSGRGTSYNRYPDDLPEGYLPYSSGSATETTKLELIKLMNGTTGAATTNFLRTSIAKQNIESVAFTNSLGNHTPNGTNCWDVGYRENGGILAWATDTDSDGLYEITIGGNGAVKANSGYYLFAYMTNLTSITGLENFDTSGATDMQYMFYNCSNLTSLTLTSFNTAKVTNMLCMFEGCSKLTSLDLSSFDTSKVTNFEGMFSGCSVLTSLNISSFVTTAATNMSSMFMNCAKITTLDLSNFRTSSVTNMQQMFYGCAKLTSLTVTTFDTSAVTAFNSMFYGCAALTSLDISSFTPTAATYTTFMFSGCTNLVTIYASTSFNVSNITNSANMFTSSTKLKGENGTTYNSSNVTKTYARRDQSSTPGYFTYRAAPTIPSQSPSVPTIQSIKELNTYEGTLTSVGNALSSMLDEILK